MQMRSLQKASECTRSEINKAPGSGAGNGGRTHVSQMGETQTPSPDCLAEGQPRSYNDHGHKPEANSGKLRSQRIPDQRHSDKSRTLFLTLKKL